MAKWWQRSNTAEIKPLPWLSPRAVEYFESLLTPEMNVLEHGSGGSTLWLASRVASVTSIEGDADWQTAVRSQAPANVTIKSQNEFDVMEVFHEFDLILIDGEPLEDRIMYLANAPFLLKAGGIVVLDNANRPQYADDRAALKTYAKNNYLTIDANEPGTSFLVTDFYRLP